MSATQLQLARALALPSREAMLSREHSVQHFWYNNDQLLTQAWKEWEETEVDTTTFTLGDSLLDKNLREAVNAAWEDPSKEHLVKSLLEEVATDVYQFQFFDPERLAVLRGYLEKVWNANIPMRPPYGIVLNRRGAMIHKGNVPHAAKPITSGDRTNLVLWLFGDNGRIPAPGSKRTDIDAKERWTTPKTTPDGYAPF